MDSSRKTDLSYLNIDLYNKLAYVLIISHTELELSAFVDMSKEFEPLFDVITLDGHTSVPLIVNSSVST